MMKRGTSQIDWIMSLGLFLLWVSFFFIFIKPQIDIQTNKNSNIIFLKSDFFDEFKLELVKYPLFIESNNSGELLPIIILQNQTDIKFMDGYNYVYFGDKLIFLANLTNQITTFWILEGTDQYQNYTSEGLEVVSNRFSTENFSARMSDGLVNSVSFKGREIIKDSFYKVNVVPIYPENYTFQDYGFMGVYTASQGNFNITTMMFDKNKEIQFFLHNFNDYYFTIDLELEEFDSYYSSNVLFGDFNYTEETQVLNFTADYLTLYDSNSFSMFFNSNASFNFTYYNDTLDMSIRIPLAESDSFRYLFKEGGHENISRQTYDARFGLRETIEGIFLENISTNYTSLRQRWRFPQNFHIQIYDNSSSFTYLYEPIYEIGNPPGKISVYAEKEDLNSLDMEGVFRPVSVSYRIW